MTRNISIKLDDKTFEEFSIACIKKRTNKADEIRRMIKNFIKESK